MLPDTGINPRTMAAARWCGRLLIGIGLLHLAYGLVTYWSDATAIAGGGFGGASGDVEHERFFWFMLGGPAMLLAGAWARHEFLRAGRLPRILAWYIALLAATVVFLPDSGFWLFWPVAAMAFVASPGSRT
ncbi:DUF6463 family protein [Embleya scabrispora]|uniref:DUF6463 family protein n=1 Tax=Embleya scabrispora TaxID=159449 RepID=UPI00036F91CF|nr:DUF6463 family protein [Embleya scabrispora]MYS83458.1 hypothetical protein [Streptomyces sp. SID5474]